jgi:hypothetical protein
MKNLVFHYECSLLTGFRCAQSPLWTGFTVVMFFEIVVSDVFWGPETVLLIKIFNFFRAHF